MFVVSVPNRADDAGRGDSAGIVRHERPYKALGHGNYAKRIMTTRVLGFAG